MPRDSAETARVDALPKEVEEVLHKARETRISTLERLRPMVQKAAVAFSYALEATTCTMTPGERTALYDRAHGFLSEALNRAVKDIVLSCIYATPEERARQPLEDFLVFRACAAVLKEKAGK